MTLGKNLNNGEGTITLSAVEQKAFEDGHPVIKTTSYRKGIVEIEVKRRIVCPNAETRSFLRKLAAANAEETLTVQDVIKYAESKEGKTEIVLMRYSSKDIANDLQRYMNNVGGEVPISDIMEG